MGIDLSVAAAHRLILGQLGNLIITISSYEQMLPRIHCNTQTNPPLPANYFTNCANALDSLPTNPKILGFNLTRAAGSREVVYTLPRWTPARKF